MKVPPNWCMDTDAATIQSFSWKRQIYVHRCRNVRLQDLRSDEDVWTLCLISQDVSWRIWRDLSSCCFSKVPNVPLNDKRSTRMCKHNWNSDQFLSEALTHAAVCLLLCHQFIAGRPLLLLLLPSTSTPPPALPLLLSPPLSQLLNLLPSPLAALSLGFLMAPVTEEDVMRDGGRRGDVPWGTGSARILLFSAPDRIRWCQTSAVGWLSLCLGLVIDHQLLQCFVCLLLLRIISIAELMHDSRRFPLRLKTPLMKRPHKCRYIVWRAAPTSMPPLRAWQIAALSCNVTSEEGPCSSSLPRFRICQSCRI